MLKELFESVRQTAIDGATPKSVRPEAEPGHIYYFQGERKEADPQPRLHNAGSIEQLVLASRTLKAESTRAVIWYNRAGVVCLLDDGTRRDKISFRLNLSDQMQSLAKMEKEQDWDSHYDFLKLLRLTFAGCVLSKNLVEHVRKIRFEKKDGGSSEIKHGKVSMGKSLEAELAGTDILPEEITLRVPIFSQGSVTARIEIQCYLEVDPVNQKFQLLPLPGRIEDAVCSGEAAVGDEIRALLNDSTGETGIEVFYGQP